MTKKYIEADKLIAEIERWRDKAKEKYNENIYSMGRCDALAEFRNYIVSLQQEFEVHEFSFKGGTATINGVEHSFKPGKAKVIILDITENED